MKCHSYTVEISNICFLRLWRMALFTHIFILGFVFWSDPDNLLHIWACECSHLMPVVSWRVKNGIIHFFGLAFALIVPGNFYETKSCCQQWPPHWTLPCQNNFIIHKYFSENQRWLINDWFCRVHWPFLWSLLL